MQTLSIPVKKENKEAMVNALQLLGIAFQCAEDEEQYTFFVFYSHPLLLFKLGVEVGGIVIKNFTMIDTSIIASPGLIEQYDNAR